ncbi:MAG: hypothetical protein OEU84_15095, partial [Xanthomonadales bacterium]|nr:hypothetical protein [Xanthomonadales bacterium]
AGDGVRQMCEFIIRRRLDPAKPQPGFVGTVDVNSFLGEKEVPGIAFQRALALQISANAG